MTGIEWTERTWNPTVGCDLVSPGCTNCYAMKVAHRLANNPNPKVAGKYRGLTRVVNGRPVWTGAVRPWPQHLELPLKRRTPTVWFVDSESDLFHPGLADADIDRVFAVMALAPQHTFQILTKRPERMLKWFSVGAADVRRDRVIAAMYRQGAKFAAIPWPLPNVWLGVSVEDQKRADERIPALLDTPAAVRFLSCEPLLGPVDLADRGHGWLFVDELASGQRTGLQWVIAGGESGPNARPMHPDWARGLRDQCAAAGVPFFFKQWGEWCPGVRCDRPQAPTDRFPDDTLVSRVGKKAAGRLLDGREHNAMPPLRAEVPA